MDMAMDGVEAGSDVLAHKLLSQVDACFRNRPHPCFVALSGGVDSMLLLEALTRIKADVTAIHVHHGLNPAADTWADFCRAQADKRHIPFLCERITLVTQANIEAQARRARYEVFAKLVGKGSLFLAQHQDDQAETMLLRLARGAGVTGLSGMSECRQRGDMTLVRPLLHMNRSEIEVLAKHWQLDWMEDPSNKDVRFARNWVRHQLLPLWQSRTPAIREQVARSARHLGESAELLDDLAMLDTEKLADGQPGWSIVALGELSEPRRNNLLRYWLAGKEPWRPGEDVLARLQQEVLSAEEDRQPQLVLDEGVLTRFRSRLYWVPKQAFSDFPSSCQWQLHRPLHLGALMLVAEEGVVASASPALRPRTNRLSGQLVLPSCSVLDIRFAKGGEKLLHHGQHQKISELWRVAGIPPWLRHWLPLFYLDNALVAVVGIGVADDWQVPSVDRGVLINWQLPDTFDGC
jgi:tRNA(Ile)-lysidine synthase